MLTGGVLLLTDSSGQSEKGLSFDYCGGCYIEEVPKSGKPFSGFISALLGTLRSEDGDGSENGAEKVFAFFQSSSRLLQVTNFVKCRWILLKLNS